MEKMIVTCEACSQQFEFTQEEREIYARFGFENTPKRCKVCRGSKKATDEAARPKKLMFMAICDDCGKEARLPFQPKGDKPVYCQACFMKHKMEA